MCMWQVSDAYEAYVGRWSRPVADLFLRWLAVPPGRRWLDVGCGTGALTERIAGAASVVGVDPSVGFLDNERTVVAGDATALPLRDNAVDAVVSGLAVNFVPRPAVALAEFARVAAPGAVVAAYVWDYADGMAMMRHFWDAAVAVDPAAAELDEGRAPLALTELWAGLDAVATTSIEVPTVFREFDDYWRPFLGGQGPAPAYLAALPAGQRDAIRDRLRAGLPVNADGSMALTARAFAVRGFVH